MLLQDHIINIKIPFLMNKILLKIMKKNRQVKNMILLIYFLENIVTVNGIKNQMMMMEI